MSPETYAQIVAELTGANMPFYSLGANILIIIAGFWAFRKLLALLDKPLPRS